MTKALILCAGKGSRLNKISQTCPKPMLPLNGRPLLEHILLQCKAFGINEVAINTSYLADQITDYFSYGNKLGMKISYSFEPQLLGTSGALNNFKHLFDQDFFILYGDIISSVNLSDMIASHKKHRSKFTIALRQKPWDYKTQSFVRVSDQLHIKEFFEKPDDSDIAPFKANTKYINSSIYLASPDTLNYIPDGRSDFSYDIIPNMIQAGENILGYDIKNSFFREIGTEEKYNKAINDLKNETNDHLWGSYL